MRKRVLILGATGMLGSAVYGVLKNTGSYDLRLAVRDRSKLDLLYKRYGKASGVREVAFDAQALYQDYLEKKGHPSEHLALFVKEAGEVDYVINAIGVVIVFSLQNPALTFFINGALPHILARVFGKKLIHITTDCAYNGQEGFPYNERSQKTPVDLYGLSKSLGEPMDCLTLRTSIVGPELVNGTGLLAWFLAQKGKAVQGFANHFWNGVTTKEFGNICDRIMTSPQKYPETGLYHIFSNVLSKYEMLTKFKEKYKVACDIRPDYSNKLNRTLATIHKLQSDLCIPSFEVMLKEL